MYCGTDTPYRLVLTCLTWRSFQGYSTHVQFQVQPLIEHQDFLGGKGMGKIVSMSRKSNAKIQLVPASESGPSSSSLLLNADICHCFR